MKQTPMECAIEYEDKPSSHPAGAWYSSECGVDTTHETEGEFNNLTEEGGWGERMEVCI
jgi:hypothetical protein